MGEIVQSAGGVVYYLDSNREPKYLIIKRHALSGKIERVAPKGKIQAGEKIENAAAREVSEETGIPLNQMKLKQRLGMTSLRSSETKKGQLDKDVTYFLIEYSGDPNDVKIIQEEGYIGNHKRANIGEILSLVYYEDIRELFRKSYILIKDQKKKSDIKQNFMDKLDL
ncbi:NUDIX domain-containing protein [Candidatus Gracilibacteria bacterium]|nr:NUDIX domain-containing protein [Candidatus Gracilibacteria bacterium]